jgi:AcrR family transcriptional regulator
MSEKQQVLRKDTRATRSQLITAAEQLFAEKGFSNVTCGEINDKALQKNKTSLQYHFGGKDEVLQSILEKHLSRIDIERGRILDELEQKVEISPREVASAIVLPLAARLADPDGGLDYIRLSSKLIGAIGPSFLSIAHLESNVFTKRTEQLTLRVTSRLPDQIQFVRSMLAVTMIFNGLADYAEIVSEENTSVTDIQKDLFITGLIDAVEVLLVQPASPESRRIAASGKAK